MLKKMILKSSSSAMIPPRSSSPSSVGSTLDLTHGVAVDSFHVGLVSFAHFINDTWPHATLSDYDPFGLRRVCGQDQESLKGRSSRSLSYCYRWDSTHCFVLQLARERLEAVEWEGKYCVVDASLAAGLLV